MTKNECDIPVFFSADDNYAPFLATAVNSAIKNSDPGRRYRAIVLHKGMNEEYMTRISSLAKENFRVDFVEMEAGLEEITDRLSNRLRYDIFTLTIYFRLFIPAMFPEYDKGIYVDSDIVVKGDIGRLYDIDLEDDLIGACRDLSIAHDDSLMDYTVNVVGMKRGDYVNSGVLLMNMKALRDKKFDEHFLNLLKTYHFDSVAPDQDYINAICRGRIRYLPASWNARPGEIDTVTSPDLIHYNLYSKPWRRDGVRYESEFWRYAEDCGFIDEIKAIKKEHPPVSETEDIVALGILVKRACQIKRERVTLKRVADAGVRVRL